MINCILQFLTINDIETIHLLLLTSKDFNNSYIENNHNICQFCAKQILIDLQKMFNSHKVKLIDSTPPYASSESNLNVNWINCLINWEKYFYNCFTDIKKKLLISQSHRRATGDRILWKETYLTLCGAYKLEHYQFISEHLWHLTKICLNMTNARTYEPWNNDINNIETQNHKHCFEGILFMIIKISLHVVEKTSEVSHIFIHAYLDEGIMLSCCECLNRILNPNYKSTALGFRMPGLYDTLDSNNNLYKRLVDYYNKEKNTLSLVNKKKLSKLVFDNVDYDNIKNHYNNNTLHTCTCATLKKFLRCSSLDFMHNRNRPKLSGNKQTLINRTYHYIIDYNLF